MWKDATVIWGKLESPPLSNHGEWEFGNAEPMLLLFIK